jgi:hypothetical protein
MSDTFTLLDSHSLADLRTYLGRAGRVEDGSVRLIADGGVLAVYAAVIYPAGLLDESPTILGLRTFALPNMEAFDTVVPLGSLIQRVDKAEEQVRDVTAPVTVGLPMAVMSVTWAAISPPRGGWSPLEPMSSVLLDGVAKAGIHEVADAIPDGTGEQIVHRVRSEVWGRPIDNFEHVPAGAAFAALTLGFIAEDEVITVFESGPWTRLTSQRGHVLVKRRAWSISR